MAITLQRNILQRKTFVNELALLLAVCAIALGFFAHFRINELKVIASNHAAKIGKQKDLVMDVRKLITEELEMALNKASGREQKSVAVLHWDRPYLPYDEFKGRFEALINQQVELLAEAQMEATIKRLVSPEDFIDKIVKRLKDKQLH